MHFKFGSGNFRSKICSKFDATIYFNSYQVFLDSTSAAISQIELRISALTTRTKTKDKICVLIFNIHFFSISSSYFL